MIKLRRIGPDYFSMEFENGNTKIAEEIDLDAVVSIFDEAGHALTDNAHRTLIEIRDQRTQINQLKKQIKDSEVSPVVAA